MHCKKRLAFYLSTAGMSQSLVSNIPAGDGKIANSFYSVEEAKVEWIIISSIRTARQRLILKVQKKVKFPITDLELSISVKIF